MVSRERTNEIRAERRRVVLERRRMESQGVESMKITCVVVVVEGVDRF